MLKALFFLVTMLVSALKERRELALENLVLRPQLAVFKRSCQRPRLRSTDRLSVQAVDFATEFIFGDAEEPLKKVIDPGHATVWLESLRIGKGCAVHSNIGGYTPKPQWRRVKGTRIPARAGAGNWSAGGVSKIGGNLILNGGFPSKDAVYLGTSGYADPKRNYHELTKKPNNKKIKSDNSEERADWI